MPLGTLQNCVDARRQGAFDRTVSGLYGEEKATQATQQMHNFHAFLFSFWITFQ